MNQRDLVQSSLSKFIGSHPTELVQNPFLDRVCEIIVAFLNKNSVAPEDVPGLITSVHSTLSRLFLLPQPTAAARGPALNINESVTPDYIICLEDGKRLLTLKRYIGGRYGLTPEQYRQKWNLPDDYPMVAPNYAKKRSQIAKKMGLGRKAPKKRRKGR